MAKSYPVPKGAKTEVDANGVTWYFTQGKQWRNSSNGDVSKTAPSVTPGLAPAPGQPGAPQNPGTPQDPAAMPPPAPPSTAATDTSPANNTFYDLDKARQDLEAQVRSGGIQQWQADNEMARLKGLNDAATANIKGDLGGLAAGNTAVSDSLGSGVELAKDFFKEGSLGRVNEAVDPAVAAATEQARLRSIDTTQADADRARLGQLRDLAGQTDPAITEAIARAREAQVDPNAAIVRGELTKQYQNAGNVDPVLQEIMDRRKAGLEGLTAPELTALREQGNSGMNQAMQTAMRQANVGNLMANRSGNVQGAAMPGIAQARSLGQAQLERDILLANVAERDKRLNEYQGLGSEIDTNKFNRTQSTLGSLGAFNQTQAGIDLGNTQNYQGLIAQTEANKFNRLNTADQNFANYNQNQSGIDLANLNNYQNYLTTARNDTLQRQIYNIGQLGQEKAGQIGMIFGAGEFGAGQDASNKANEIAKQNIEAQKKYYEALLAQNQAALAGLTMPMAAEAESGGGGGGSLTSTTPFVPNPSVNIGAPPADSTSRTSGWGGY